jgi:hypothetical protein
MSTGYPTTLSTVRNRAEPNAFVFEWLNKTDEFRRRVAIYGTWNVYDNIFNKQRSGLVMQTDGRKPQQIETARCLAVTNSYDTTTRFDEEDVTTPAADTASGLCRGAGRVPFVGYG